MSAETEPVTELVTEALTEPLTELVTEAVIDPGAELVTKPGAELVTEPLTDLVTESSGEHTVQQQTEESVGVLTSHELTDKPIDVQFATASEQVEPLPVETPIIVSGPTIQEDVHVSQIGRNKRLMSLGQLLFPQVS